MFRATALLSGDAIVLTSAQTCATLHTISSFEYNSGLCCATRARASLLIDLTNRYQGHTSTYDSTPIDPTNNSIRCSSLYASVYFLDER